MRVVVAGMHIALGVLVALEGVVMLLQTRVNLLWETGFYGEVTTFTLAVLVASGVTIALGLLVFAGGVGYSRNRALGMWVLVNSLLLLTCGVPEPIAWTLVAGSFLVVVEQYRHARALLASRDD